MKSHRLTRRTFLGASGSALAAVPLTAAERAPAGRLTNGLIDCQSHLFFPEVLDLMRRRNADPVVHDKGGMMYLKMGDWLRKVPPVYIDVDVKLAAMDASGIEIAMLSTNDPAPEWFGDDGTPGGAV